MSYTPTDWKNGENPPINAANLNNIERGITSNAEDIEELKGDMKFKGEISTLPQSPSPGEVYQATIANLVSQNKAGDLLVFTSNSSWHVIPSGDEHDGTVTYIEAGPGISINGGSITRSGTISLDTAYAADGSHNGLMTSAQFTKLANLAAISESGSWNNLKDIPDTATRPMYSDLTQNSQTAVVSQSGLKTLFDGKADSQHNHLIEHIKDSLGDTGEEHDLYYYLASISDGVENNIPVKAAPQNHLHGNITSSGYLLTDQGTSANNRWLKTDGSGSITSQETIPSSAIRGYTLRNDQGNSPIDLSQVNTLTNELSTRLQQVEEDIGDGSSEGIAKDIADIKTNIETLQSSIETLNNHTTRIGTLENKMSKVICRSNFLKKAKEIDNVSIAKNSVAYPKDGKSGNHNYIDISQEGYTPIAIYGFDLDGASNVSGSSYVSSCYPLSIRIAAVDNKYEGYWQIRNTSTNTAKIKIKMYVLYKQNDPT